MQAASCPTAPTPSLCSAPSHPTPFVRVRIVRSFQQLRIIRTETGPVAQGLYAVVLLPRTIRTLSSRFAQGLYAAPHFLRTIRAQPLAPQLAAPIHSCLHPTKHIPGGPARLPP